MTTVEEIEKAVRTLPEEDLLRLRVLLDERLDDEWDRQFAIDARSGRLDGISADALAEHQSGHTKPFPPDEEPC